MLVDTVGDPLKPPGLGGGIGESSSLGLWSDSSVSVAYGVAMLKASYRCLLEWGGHTWLRSLMSKGLEALSQSQTRSSLCTGACLSLEGSSQQAAP